MKLIDADKFLSYLIFSKHIDGLTCGEVKEAIEMSKVDVLDKIRAWIDKPVIRDEYSQRQNDYCDGYEFVCNQIREIIDKYRAESEDKE